MSLLAYVLAAFMILVLSFSVVIDLAWRWMARRRFVLTKGAAMSEATAAVSAPDTPQPADLQLSVDGHATAVARRTAAVAPADPPALAYDVARFGDRVRWTKHCIYLRGQPVVLLSGEFQYWRVADRDRWRPLLQLYRASGFNCVRIYFHWGVHSPAEGQYYFDGNRYAPGCPQFWASRSVT